MRFAQLLASWLLYNWRLHYYTTKYNKVNSYECTRKKRRNVTYFG